MEYDINNLIFKLSTDLCKSNGKLYCKFNGKKLIIKDVQCRLYERNENNCDEDGYDKDGYNCEATLILSDDFED